jgi:outer membrane immunogenic protein
MNFFRTFSVMSALSFAGGAAAAQDWTGFYGGLTAGRNVDGVSHGTAGVVVFRDFDDGPTGGIFGGYNVQRGQFVFGAEASVAAASIVPEGTTIDGFTRFTDVKARVGYAIDKVLVYGTVGYTWGRLEGTAVTLDMEGMSYGFGADFKVNDRVFVGLEYLKRETDAPGPTPPGGEFISENSVLSLRVGMTF